MYWIFLWSATQTLHVYIVQAMVRCYVSCSSTYIVPTSQRPCISLWGLLTYILYCIRVKRDSWARIAFGAFETCIQFSHQAHVSFGRAVHVYGCVVPVHSPGTMYPVRPRVHRHMYLPANYSRYKWCITTGACPARQPSNLSSRFHVQIRPELTITRETGTTQERHRYEYIPIRNGGKLWIGKVGWVMAAK